ncbi:nucleoside-diphosphate sugar epimerase [Lentzea guizhouensis]|uniref:Nucleoside-diphosphate sugar epimerase n=1 Tax=Lentzea guizhouensis TaxID=1586287 RepID=A0A1B2HRM9_9PSEU|nr:nucleoside-diphosphate sugar epimerase [Lentzea guizhouensis]ANZ40358.1 nucleoside-diphosphate sugar epimerase [Lentzea guizhouensis]
MPRVLITGVRGKTGVPLAELLQGHAEVLGGSSDPSSVRIDGVVPTRFSWDDPSTWDVPADAVYLVRPDREDAPDLVERLLARVAASTRIVLLSERDVDSFADDAWATRAERVVRDSGHPWTFLRPSWFMQVLTDDRFYREDIAERGRLPYAGSGARIAWIDARDIAAVAARALVEGGHDGQVYELTGPESLTLPETASVLSSVLGREVVHEEVTIEEAVAGLDGFDRDEFGWTLERVRDGVFAGVTDTAEEVTGRPARSLADFATDHRSAWTGGTRS